MQESVRITISDPNIELWDAIGGSLDTINVNNPELDGYAAKYQYFVNYEYTPSGVILFFSSKIIMPNWPAYSNGNTIQKHEWDRFFSALKSHEMKHHNIAVEEVKKLEQTINGIQNITEENLNTLVLATQSEIKKRTDELDDVTNHGESEGAILNKNKGGGGGCFHPDTEVLLRDGVVKNISEVNLDDELLLINIYTMESLFGKTTSITSHYSSEIYNFYDENGNVILTSSGDQTIITQSGPVKARHIFDKSGLMRCESTNGRVSEQFTIIRKELRSSREEFVISINTETDLCFVVGKLRNVANCNAPGPIGGTKKR